MLNIITEKNDWEKVLEQLGVYDFYHTYDYHHLSKNDGEKPVLLVYTKDNLTIALPLLIRQINNTDYFDAKVTRSLLYFHVLIHISHSRWKYYPA